MIKPEILQPYFSEDWFELLKGEFEKDYFQQCMAFLKQQSTSKLWVAPTFSNMWKPWSYPHSKIRVVIVADQPHKSSDGLAFSTASMQLHLDLIEIFQEIYYNGGVEKIKGVTLEDVFCCGDLHQWSKQGVMLLNSVLTTGELPAEHKMAGWQHFTMETLALLNQKEEPLVFIFLGDESFTMSGLIDRDKHEVIIPKKLKNSECFKQCNDFLTTRYPELPPINWGIWSNYCRQYLVKVMNEDWKEIHRLADQVKQEWKIPTYFESMFKEHLGPKWLSSDVADAIQRVRFANTIKQPKKGKELLFEQDNFLYLMQTIGANLNQESIIHIEIED